MPLNKFKLITVALVGTLVLSSALGIKNLCACSANYPAGASLGIIIPEEIDEKTLMEVEITANARLAGRSLSEIVEIAKSKCGNLSESDLAPVLYRPDQTAPRLDPLSNNPVLLICWSPLQALASKTPDQLNYKTLGFQVGTSSNLLWEDQIAFTLLLDKQVIQQVKAAHTRRLFHIPRNFFESLVN